MITGQEAVNRDTRGHEHKAGNSQIDLTTLNQEHAAGGGSDWRKPMDADEAPYNCLQLEHVYGVAVCCSVLQCVAVCCGVWQCVAVCGSVLRCVALCCSVWQCVALCCIVLQCVALCCSMWQCVAVCGSVL